MRRFFRVALSAAALSLGAVAALAGSASQADARARFFLGIGLPPIYLGPPVYYAPPPPPVYYHPRPYYGPPPGYYQPPPCRPQHEWRWDGYRWRRMYIGCW